jgi:hypothetical protein
MGVADVGGLGKGVPTIVEGDTLGVGMVSSGLTPALPISTEPNGIPERETPFGDKEGVAAIDEGLLLTPVPQTAALPGNDIPAAIPIPPPSYVLALDIPDDALAVAGQFVPYPAIPAPPIIPTGPVAAALIPGEASSVAPRGIPV